MAKKAPCGRGKKQKTDSFVLTLPLRTSQEDLRELSINLETIRQIYNASSGESRKRLRKLRASPEWQAARELPRTVKDKTGKTVPNPARHGAFRAADELYGFTQASIETYATECKNQAGFDIRLGAPETQRMAQRAFSAVQQYAFGKRGMPRFKGLRGVRSLEGKSDAAALRWRDNHLCYGGMKLKALVDEKDQYACEALSRKVKYCRLLRKTIKGRGRYYVQLVLTGKPPKRDRVKLGKGTVGMDQGPSNLAVVTQTATGEVVAHKVRFCATIEQPWGELRRLRRGVDRSRRATNPQNYLPDGKVKPGPKRWTMSTRGRKAQGRVAELERVTKAERERCHGELGNDILGLGDRFNWEGVSYKAFQKMYGRSIQVRAPGGFFTRFKLKAESAGAVCNEFSTRTTKLSQFCHIAKTYTKKPLSQRRHVFPDGTWPQQGSEPCWVDRDLYSAWLGVHVVGDTLDADHAREGWSAAQLPLRTASRPSLEPASARGLLRAAAHGPSEQVVCNREAMNINAAAHGANGVVTPRAEDCGQGYVRRRGSPTRLPKTVTDTGETWSFTNG